MKFQRGSTQIAIVRAMRDAVQLERMRVIGECDNELVNAQDESAMCRRMAILMHVALCQNDTRKAIGIASSLATWSRNLAIRLELIETKRTAVCAFADAVPTQTARKVRRNVGPMPKRQLVGRDD